MRKPEAQRLMPPGTRQNVRGRFSTTVRRVAARIFPEREVLLRANGRVRFFHMNAATQVACVLVLLSLLPAVIYTTGRDFLFQDSVIAQKSNEVDSLKAAYRQLQSESAESQMRYRLITQQLEAKHAYLLSVLEQNNALRKNIGQMRSELQNSEEERRTTTASREALLTELSQLESFMKRVSSEKETLVSSLSAKEQELNQAASDQARMARAQRRLQTRADDLQDRLANLQIGQQEVLDRLSARTAGSIDEIKGLIAKTGLDPNRLLADVTSGIGGPFVEFDERNSKRSDMQLAALNSHIDQWDELQQVMRRLPLAAPLDKFAQMSAFGKRRDPFNGKWAMHSGIDLSAAPKSPILSAAPGVVVFAGTNGSYGRMVEIDHGMGIRTRYGHMSSISVRKGQKIGHRQEIGIIGSSGRSTGLHLHYEVQVNDVPYDPVKFIEAGKHVFKG